jgi:hypothetical protein
LEPLFYQLSSLLSEGCNAFHLRPITPDFHRNRFLRYDPSASASKTTMGKALRYALAQWPSLEVYVKEPGIEIKNNLLENAIRPTALGKKN